MPSDIAILVPSHIKSLEQIEYLRACLRSLVNQTYTADVLVSISFEVPYRAHLNFAEFPQVRFIVSDSQKYQMEHLYVLSHHISPYKLIMFCDDDDTYELTRVETFNEYFNETPSIIGIREKSVLSHEVAEYWAYGIIPSILADFYDRMSNNMGLLQHKFADVYFRNFLFLTRNKLFVTFTAPLYNYTTTNPNSICTVNKRNTSIEDDIILVAKNPDDNVFEKFIKDIVLSKTGDEKGNLINIIATIEPLIQEIRSLLPKLYA
jgi:hypothetical protein